MAFTLFLWIKSGRDRIDGGPGIDTEALHQLRTMVDHLANAPHAANDAIDAVLLWKQADGGAFNACYRIAREYRKQDAFN